MKKVMMTLALAVLAGMAAAEPLSAREVTGGLKFGFGIANAFGDDVENSGVKSAFSAGAFFRWSPTRVFAFQPEFHYIRKGASRDAGGISFDTTLSYMEIPFLIRLSIPLNRVRPNLILGDYVAFNVGAEASSGGESMDISDNIETVEGGLVVGTGLDILVGKGLIMVEYRAEIGATSLVSDDSVDAHNIAHLFFLGYAF